MNGLFRHGPERPETRQPYAPKISLEAEFPGQVFRHGDRTRKAVALTFDDGPDNWSMPLLLDVLSGLGVKATFFLVGQLVRMYPQVVERLVRDGHAYGNLTDSHANLLRTPPDEIRREISNAENEIARVTGARPALFRPPYGALDSASAREVIAAGYRIIFWDADSLDYAGLAAPQIVVNILAHAGPGSIVLQEYGGGSYAAQYHSLQAIPHLVAALRQEGFEFLTVPELLKVPMTRT